jgi:hypothetical protein
VSHTVRSLRRDPIPGDSIRLVLTLAEDTPAEEIADAVEPLDGVTAVETDAVIDQI